MGEMASGVAHEINNPLGILSLLSARLTQLARSGKLDGESAVKLSADVEDSLARVATIIRSLRSFARDGSRDPFSKVPVAEVVEAAVGFCRARCKDHGIALHVSSEHEALVIDCRAIEITQLLLNLLNNAREAAERQHVGERWIELCVFEARPYVEIQVTNSGPKIEEHHRAKIFEPFYTTKPIGTGTGLGLSVSLGLAEAHGGTLMLDDTSLHTCFVLRLPLEASPTCSARGGLNL